MPSSRRPRTAEAPRAEAAALPAPALSLAPKEELVRSMPWSGREDDRLEQLLTREWLVTNGLGGYASGTVAGVATRRYHGLLVAALPAPLGRMVTLCQVWERLRLPDGTEVRLGGEERVGRGPDLPGAGYLRELRLETGLPVWRYEVAGWMLEKRVLMPHLQNTVHILYRLLSGPGKGPLRLALEPTLHFRGHEEPVSVPFGGPGELRVIENRYELCIDPRHPSLRMLIHGAEPSFTVAGRKVAEMYYRIEESRGYEATGEVWSPGHFAIDLVPGGSSGGGGDAWGAGAGALTASTEDWDVAGALLPKEALAAERERRRRLLEQAHPAARRGPAAELVLAADQFVVRPGRHEDEARAHAAGDEPRTVIAGYHWFTDWGRDTMISLEGLTVPTGRVEEARYVLRTFAHHVRDGLIPNLFPEGDREGLYHTADATLWFFHAVDRYLAASGDRATLALLLPTLLDIVDHHLAGTRFGIGVDPRDGLLTQGAEGYQLTWMDAKVDGWVVTPRRGKAVEINALWYNALSLAAGWAREAGQGEPADLLAAHAARAWASFNERFWYAERGYLYDVVDGERGDDPACRPNQVFAIALPHPVLDRERWEPVMDVVTERLLTPVGLRSLAPGHPDYKATYDGDLRARDAAYHQGTVWGWLIGPYVDAWLKLHPDDTTGARRLLEGFVPHLGEACLGQVSEIFDAEEPFRPRGCVAQAWSVAEVLRCWVKTAG